MFVRFCYLYIAKLLYNLHMSEKSCTFVGEKKLKGNYYGNC